jgi:histidyl-tRNA synthetase
MFIENGLASTPLPLKTFYITPAFRYERPQAGRLREFHQFGIEVFGSESYVTDAEVIFAASSFLNKLGVKTKLEINSIGCRVCRNEYNKALKEYFLPNLDKMCPTCQSRFDKNPLRMLDCKEEGCKVYTANAPKIVDYLCDDCKTHFEGVKNLLTEGGVEYTVNPYIVRGLDYYSRTVFEFVSTEIGAQGTVCGGGRYDGLIEQLGGSPQPAIGFGAGIERLMLLMDNSGVPFPEEERPVIYIAGMDDESRKKAFMIANKLRGEGISAEIDHMGRSVKAQFKYADKLGAKFVATIGESELESGEVEIKKMADGSREKVKFENIYTYLKKEIG